MRNTVFFSWQSDKGGRNFIEQALNRAIGAINSNLDIQDADRPDSQGIVFDKDTKGVPGSPSIVDTILGKIDGAFCFVADLTFVAERSDGGGVPNPNVLIEYGYALRSLGEKQIISVMNEAYGTPRKENMPFDLAHKRFPITYNVPAGATQEDRKQQLTKLSKILEVAIRNILDHHLSRQPVINPPAFSARLPALGKARFSSPLSAANKKTLVGRTGPSFHSTAQRLVLDDGPAMYLRVFPTRPPNREWSIPELKKKESGSRGLIFLPFQDPTSRFNAEDGCGWYSEKGKGGDLVESDSVVIAFTNGEIWAVDTSWLRWWAGKICLRPVVDLFNKKLEDYSSFLQSLGVEPHLAGLQASRISRVCCWIMRLRPGASRYQASSTHALPNNSNSPDSLTRAMGLAMRFAHFLKRYAISVRSSLHAISFLTLCKIPQESHRLPGTPSLDSETRQSADSPTADYSPKTRMWPGEILRQCQC